MDAAVYKATNDTIEWARAKARAKALESEKARMEKIMEAALAESGLTTTSGSGGGSGSAGPA
eukprot:COSAG05_NODE_8063_length_740_cov_0.750390_1_plen_61_part_10